MTAKLNMDTSQWSGTAFEWFDQRLRYLELAAKDYGQIAKRMGDLEERMAMLEVYYGHVGFVPKKKRK